MMSDKRFIRGLSIILVEAIKRNGKYTYVDASRIEDQGTRLYDVNGARLLSVTTILGKTKNQQFSKRLEGQSWRQRSRYESKMYLVVGGQLCTNSWNTISQELVTMILQHSDRRRKPWPKKLLMWVLHLWKNTMVPEVTLYYPGLYAGSTDLVCLHNSLETVVDFKQG